MKFDYQTKIFISYSLITTLSVVFSFLRINRLESIINATVYKKLKIKPQYNTGGACIYGVDRSNVDHVMEYVSAHIQQGILDYTFFVKDSPLDETYLHITGNYSNLGIDVSFKKSTLKHHDLWECVADNVFNPYVNMVYTSDLNSFMFPLTDKYSRVNKNEHEQECISFKQYEFYENKDLENHDESWIGAYRNITKEYRTSDYNTRVYILGKTSDERVKFLKTYRLRKLNCRMSKTHGIGKLMIKASTNKETKIDNRMFDLKTMYHITKL